MRDDGVGFDVAAAEGRLDSGRHLGMISMRERAELEKGRLEIRSQIGKGTEVRVSFEHLTGWGGEGGRYGDASPRPRLRIRP